MQDKYYKYALLLLKKGLCIKRNQSLVINAPITSIDFIRVLTEVACDLGVNDIYYDWYDEELKHTILKHCNKEKIGINTFWNKTKHDEYAKKNAAFLFLTSAYPNIMDDVNPNNLKEAMKITLTTRKLYRDLQSNNKVSWCIAAVATEEWGSLLFPSSKHSKEELWNLIFDICLINTKDPLLAWHNKMKQNKLLCDKFNKLKIKELHYENSLGTDLIIELSPKAIWCGGASKINGRELIVNIPTEEIFTTPNKYMTRGKVYASMPLIHSGVHIEGIYLEFKDGKIINFDAKSGKKELKNIINSDKETNMLGECAIVDKNSKIAQSGKIFYETLFDENAACHIAVGLGFKECLIDGETLNDKELLRLGYNKSKNHVDIMIGTKDLKITAATYDNKKIIIFKDGSFNI